VSTPTPPINLPGVEVDKYDLTQHGKEVGDGLAQSGLIAAIGTVATGKVGPFIVYAIGSIVGLMDKIAAKLTDAVNAVNEKSGDGLLALAQAGLRASFGVSPSTGSMGTFGAGLDGTEAGNAIGAAAMGAITSVLDTTAANDPAAGQRNAEALINAALKEGVEAYQTGLFFSVINKWIAEVPDVKEIVAQRLGLSRGSRRMLAPLFTTLATKPFQEQLNKVYRPALLSVGEVAALVRTGYLSPDAGHEALSRHGFEDAIHGGLMATGARDIGLAEVKQLYRLGIYSREDTETALLHLHVLDDQAALLLRAWDDDRLLTLMEDAATAARALYVAGQIDSGTLQGALRAAGYSEDEITAAQSADDLKLAKDTELSLAEMEAAFVAGDIALGDLTDWLNVHRYGAEAQYIIQRRALRLRIAQEDKDQKQAASDKTGQTKTVALATMEDDYANGNISREQLGAYYSARGYSDADVILLLDKADRKLAAAQAKAAAAAKKAAAPTDKPIAVSVVRDAYARGLASRDQLAAALAAAGTSDSDAAIYLALADSLRDDYTAAQAKKLAAAAPKPPRVESLSEAEDAYVEDVWSAQQLADYLAAQGYAGDAAGVILQLAEARKTREAQLAAKRAAAKPAKAGPEPTLAALTKAYKAGLITRDQLSAEYVSRGYDQEDVTLLLELADLDLAAAQAKAAGKAAPAPAPAPADGQTSSPGG
jgi:hypothetical protein